MRAKWILFITMFTLSSITLAQNNLLGEWRLTKMEYQGQIQDPHDPSLELVWTFFQNGSERLFWRHTDQNGFCEAFGNYKNTIQNSTNLETVGIISVKTFAVNPSNDGSCAKDPDMQTGSSATTQYKLKDNSLYIRLGLGDDEIYYIFSKIKDK